MLQALLANIAGMYGVYHGPDGLLEIATRCHALAGIVAAGAEKLGHSVARDAPFFDTVCISPSGGGAAEVVQAPVPDLGAAGGAKVQAVHVEEHSGPKLDEANIEGATAATYTIPATELFQDGGLYRCVVTNAAGSTTSDAATLTVTANLPPAPVIDTPAAVPTSPIVPSTY